MRSKSSDDDARKHVHPMEVENESGEVDPEPKEAQAARLGRTVRHDHVIRAASVAIVAVVLGIALVSADTFINAVGVLRTFVTQYCSWWIVLCAFLCFAVCIFVAVTKLGSIRLGGKDAKPAFSYFSWFAMLFATGQGVGLVFWAVAEPIMMYGGTPFNAPDPLFAGDTALAWTYFHWAIPAWAIYAIVSLFMAYARYNMHKDTTFRGTVEDLFPARAKRPVGIVVEILVVIATIFGLTTSLGLASYQFNSGIQQIFNIQTGQALQVAFVILFGSIATMSVWFGVVRGIKKISNANAVMSIVFVAAVFIFGPTLYILGVLPESLSVFIDQFMLMSGFTEAVNLGAGIASYGDSWQAFWSFFIFCWCFAFATFTAGFVSTISRGRTLREFVGGVVFVPAAVCIVWTCVVGGTGVWAAMSDPGIVAKTNADSSMGLFLTIGIVFFPESAVNSTLLAVAVFALSFVFRPLGAAFWGSMGDKKGRKWSLSLSIFMMTGAAFLIGCLPSYETIGLLSPILLLCLRSVQGFSAAGEYSGAAVFLAEYAPANHRGKYCSLVPASTAAGLLAGSTAALIIKALLPEADVISWGWRIPFLLAGPLGLVAHYIRTKLEDSPTYQQMTSTADPAKEAPRPTRLVFKKYKKRLATSIAATMVNSVGFYLVLTYLPTYLTSYTAMEASAAQLATDIALVTYIFIIFGAGKISDIVGRKKMLLGSCVAFILLSIPAFMMLETAQLPIVIAAELIMCVTLSFNDANIACYQAEMFPTEVRYTGAALGSNIAYVVFGGTASMVATALIDATGNGLMPAYYMMGICLVAGIILLFTAHEYAGKELNDIE